MNGIARNVASLATNGQLKYMCASQKGARLFRQPASHQTAIDKKRLENTKVCKIIGLWNKFGCAHQGYILLYQYKE